MDFHKLIFNKHNYNSIFIIINYLNKKHFILFYKKIIIIKKTAELYYCYIYQIYKILIIIIYN